MAAATTGFARLSLRAARAVLAVTLLVVAFCVGVSLSPLKSGFADGPDRGPGDVELYRAEVDRIQAGESYYAAAAAELHARGYPTRSVFNWRTPLPMWLLGVLPDPLWGKVLLSGLSLVALVMLFAAVDRNGTLRQACAAGLLLTGALMFSVLGNLFVMPVLWSGILIAISVAAFGVERPWWGVGFGIAALFCRELAAPYCVLGLAIALRGRRWREAGAWSLGMCAYAAFYLWHMAQVLPLIGPDDLAHQQGWVRLGGAAFVISMIQMNAYLLITPQWISAVVLPLALLGFAGWHNAFGQRAGIAVAMYVALFAVVGQPFNQYWGSLIAPLVCLGLARAPASIVDLWRAALARPLVAALQTRYAAPE
jgi:hypothetical protein